jgi:hypothetical protein
LYLRNADLQPTAVAARIVDHIDLDLRTVVRRVGRSGELPRRERTETAPVLHPVHREGVGVAEAVTRSHVRDAEVELVAPGAPGDVAVPPVAVATLVRELAGNGGPVRRFRHPPPQLQPHARGFVRVHGRDVDRLVVRRRTRILVLRTTRAFARVRARHVLRIAATGGDVVIRDAVGIRGTASRDVHERVEVPIRELDHRTVSVPREEVRIPVDDRQRGATLHDVHVRRFVRGDQAPVTERRVVDEGGARVVVQIDADGRRRRQATQTRRRDAPRGEHRGRAGGDDLEAVAIRIRLRAHEEPRPRAGRAVIHRSHHAVALDVVAGAVAQEFVLRHEDDVVPIVVTAGERALREERAGRVAVDQEHGARVRRLQEAPRGVPLRCRQERLVRVPRAQVARELRGQLRDRLPGVRILGVEREAVDGRAVLAHLRGIAAVAPDVDVVAVGEAGGALDPDELPGRHLLSVLDEDVVEVREDDVRAVALVDGDVLAVVLRATFVVRVRHPAHRRVDRIVFRVGRIPVHVVTGGASVVRVAPVRTLRAERTVILGERQVDREEIDPSARDVGVPRRGRAPGGNTALLRTTLDVHRVAAGRNSEGDTAGDQHRQHVPNHENLRAVTEHATRIDLHTPSRWRSGKGRTISDDGSEATLPIC